jgi:hypothetical protein
MSVCIIGPGGWWFDAGIEVPVEEVDEELEDYNVL